MSSASDDVLATISDVRRIVGEELVPMLKAASQLLNKSEHRPAEKDELLEHAIRASIESKRLLDECRETIALLTGHEDGSFYLH
jgi:hypothetical protein